MNKLACGCVPGYYWCPQHDIYTRQEGRIDRRTNAERAYDKWAMCTTLGQTGGVEMNEPNERDLAVMRHIDALYERTELGELAGIIAAYRTEIATEKDAEIERLTRERAYLVQALENR